MRDIRIWEILLAFTASYYWQWLAAEILSPVPLIGFWFNVWGWRLVLLHTSGVLCHSVGAFHMDLCLCKTTYLFWECNWSIGCS